MRIPHFDGGSYWLVPHPPFQRFSTEVGKTFNMATLSGGSRVPSLPTLAQSYPPYELRAVVVNLELNQSSAQSRDELQQGFVATLRLRV